MNPAAWFHAVSVSRRSKTPTGRVLPQEPFVVVHASVRCLLEPIAARRRESLLGEVSQSQLSMTLGAEELQPDDLVTVLSGPGLAAGARFLVEQVLSDTMRPGGVPYQVAGLVAAARSGL